MASDNNGRFWFLVRSIRVALFGCFMLWAGICSLRMMPMNTLLAYFALQLVPTFLILVIILALIQAYAQLLEEENIKIPAWLSFNSKDGVNVVSGDSLLECAAIAEASKKVVSVGINCTPPRFIHDLILSMKKVLF